MPKLELNTRNRRRKAGAILTMAGLVALLLGMFPAFSPAARAQANCQTFSQTGKQACGKFLDYWNTHGGLAQQGYPISDQLQEKSDTDGKAYTTQYFERAVFELHPENQAPYDVLLSLLGVFEYNNIYGKTGAPNQKVSTDNPLKFNETGHSVGGKFLAYWQTHGGLAQQGYPISDEFQEKSATDGKTYTVQYFQRAVFELHPENQAPYDVLLSLLGKFRYDQKHGTGANATPTAQGIAYPGANANLTGSGATFPLPLVSKWAQVYNGLYPGVQVNYQGKGSGGGKTDITNKTVDFAASDSPMSDIEWAKAGGSDSLMHIPWVMGGVVLAYNLPSVTQQLKLTGDVVAKIYLLQITNWNDPAIVSLNPGVTLPDQPIAVVHRSEGSGTTDIFTDYLSKVSTDWKSRVGRGTSVQWPGGVGAPGNDGVTNQVKLIQGAIGYIEVGYAKTNNVKYALLKNRAGNFEDATAANVSEAADSLINTSIPADLRYSITDAPGTNAYPLAGTDWAFVYVNQPDMNKGKALAYFIWWATHDGQQYSEALGYAPLPKSIQERAEAQIKRMKCGSSPCFP